MFAPAIQAFHSPAIHSCLPAFQALTANSPQALAASVSLPLKWSNESSPDFEYLSVKAHLSPGQVAAGVLS